MLLCTCTCIIYRHLHICTCKCMVVCFIACTCIFSRAALKVTSGHSEFPATAKFNKLIGSKKYVGDILLKFKHSPHENVKEKKTRSRKREESVTELVN